MMKVKTLVLLFMWLTTILATAQSYRLFNTSNGLTSSLVNNVYEDRYGLIWIATEDGLNKYDGVKITSYRHSSKDTSKSMSLANNYVNGVIEDADGNLVVSTYGGLQIYRHATDDFSPCATLKNGKMMKLNIDRMKLGKDGRLYGIGDMSVEITAKDKNRLEVRRMARPYFSKNLEKGLPKDLNIRCTLRFDDSHLLLGTDGDGVKLFDEKQRTYADYQLEIPGIAKNLQKVHYIMRDSRGNLWVALYQKGVAMVSQRKSLFGYIGRRTKEMDVIGGHCVQAICRSRNGGLWIGTDGDGMYFLKNKKSRHITKGIPQIINTLCEDSEGTLWIGSYGNPCYRYVNGLARKAEGLPDRPQVFTIKEDCEGRVWLGTMGCGLYCHDLRSRQTRHVDGQDINRFINCIYVTKKGEVLAGTFNGLYNVTMREHTFQRHIIYSIHEDLKGRLWLGTSEGLIRKDGKGVKVFTTDEGMPSNSVYAIGEDQRGLLWLSTNAGLSCFDSTEDIFTNFSVSDGIQGNEFSKGAMVQDMDGTMWFAGHDGITFFSPLSINKMPVHLHPRITALYINNVSATMLTETGGQTVMDSTIYDCHHFSLAFENNSFSLELSTKEIDTPAKCIFMYSLDGNEWISIPDGGHLVSFSNLDAGEHVFRYAVEYSGEKSDVREVTIEIRHPWWGTVWAKSLFIVVIITICILLFFWIRSKEKVKVLSLISHKIRTPMSLIISPLVQLIDNDPDKERQKTYRMMLRNARKLQHLAAQATDEEPIGPIASVDAETETDTDLQPSRTTRQIVIVEDDDEVRRYLCEQLSSDYHVHEATNGKDALSLIFEKMPDAIISDVTMPQMDGITLCRKLKKNIKLAHIPVILLTARADEESTLQGLGIGADAYITKPFNIKILCQNISNLIRLRQQLKNTYQDQLLQEDKQKDLEAIDYEDLFMQRLMDCINKHISENDFSIERLCEEVGISRAQLHRRLKEKTNQSASIFIRNVRLRQAEKLLRESRMRVSEVAGMVGFAQLTYFSNAFKELYGVSPTEFREHLLK